MSIFAPSFMGFIFVIFLIVYFLSSAIRILREYERGVVFRLGRIIPVKTCKRSGTRDNPSCC